MGKLMTGVAGIRGIIGDGLTPEVVARYGASFGTFINGGTIVVGGDTRPSRTMVRSALFSGLMATGCDIIDLGLATTPTIELMVEELEAKGGICVTASHNPVGWNAMKFLDRRGRFLGPKEGGEVNRIFNENAIKYVSTQRLGSVQEYEGSVEVHIRKVLEHPYIDVSNIRRKQFRVAVDAINSVGNLIMPNLLHELGCDVVKINGDLSGNFGRVAEPLPENLTDLSELVTNEGADIGLALDPDGDRLAIVDETGKPIGEEYTLALAIRYMLMHQKGPVVVNLSTSRASEDIARDAHVPFHRTPVGEAHVASRMDEIKAVIGGEGNGGVMLPSVHTGRDAMVGTALVLALLATEGQPLSVIMSRMPRYTMLKKKAPAENVDATSLLPRLQNAFGENASYDNRDGVRVDLDEGWVQVRLSNTEPIVRIFAEAKDKTIANELSDRAIKAME